VEQVASQIAAAVNVRSLYPANHPRVVQGVDDLARSIRDALEKGGTEDVTFILIGDDLLVGDQVIRVSALLLVREFISLLQQRGIERLTFAAGVESGELHDFVSGLVSGQGLASSRHVILGRAQIVMDDDKNVEARQLSIHQLEIAREGWARFRVEKRLPVEQLEELVWSLIDSLARSARGVLPLAPLKEHDEYTFVHSVNVALLVLAQARAFGIEGPMLYEFGMAALLHDAGKLGIPLEILNKPGALTDEEWTVMRNHTYEGAWSLAAAEKVPPLSIVVAFEHHLRHDGRANYPVLRTTRSPNLASRMTAVADAYDAMSTIRPYQQPLSRAAACEILRRRAGTFYDPLLVANFLRILGEAPGATDA
jgi:HD-GYP domain-containing protein (c-di-GMP phosphodiesterase class II)